ncbi:MAG TPA: hypothetical protein VGK26_05860 [Thermoanaerobaculia bacterium]|jgi:hypothetical protein
MVTKTQAKLFEMAAFLALLGGCVLGAAFPDVCVVCAAAGFLGYILCGWRAMVLLRLDEKVFNHPRFARRDSPRIARSPGRRAPRLVAPLLFAAAAFPARAQQTIFNVPSGDVLDKGKTYLELDVLGRPQDPSFGFFTMRGVYGFGWNIEAGANFGGFAASGRSVPVATVDIKWQPWHSDKLAFTTGAFGLFYLRGSRDGNPAALWYGEASYKLPTNTRLSAGGYWASSGYAASDPQAGALLGFEQRVNDHLNLIADWLSGNNSLGYFTPGVSVPLGNWTIYAGYSIKNGDSRGNAILFELGITF